METPLQLCNIKAYYQHMLPDMDCADWDICESVLTVRKLKKGDLLQKPGIICNHVSFVNYGLLRMYHDVDGKEKVSGFYKEGDYTGDYQSFLMREPSRIYLQALEDTEVVDLTYDDLQMIYKKIPGANLIGRLIAEELFKDMCRRSTNQVTESIDAQYAALVNDMPWLVQRVPQYMIASYLGVTPEALSRIKARSGKKSRKIPLNPAAAAPADIAALGNA